MCVFVVCVFSLCEWGLMLVRSVHPYFVTKEEKGRRVGARRRKKVDPFYAPTLLFSNPASNSITVEERTQRIGKEEAICKKTTSIIQYKDKRERERE